ncbi:MAG TPA: DUF6391 domain-containing protein [Ktedonobacterales bacterium]
MNAGDLLFGRRLRQNHALEHATVTILTERHPRLRVAARSSARGFVIYADLDPALVRPAAEDALRRLRRGEAHLAIHPHCGTNLAVGTSVALVGSFFALTAVRPRVRAASALVSSLAGIVAARPLGQVVQRHVTTLPDVAGVRIVSVARRRRLGMTIVEVRTEAG